MIFVRMNRGSGRKIAAAIAFAACLQPAPAAAGETRYEYDTRGRLIRVSQSGSNADYDARYSYDKADNRLSYTVSKASIAVVIVPVPGGYRVIPIN
jgi:hypothetical protein